MFPILFNFLRHSEDIETMEFNIKEKRGILSVCKITIGSCQDSSSLTQADLNTVLSSVRSVHSKQARMKTYRMYTLSSIEDCH